MASTISNLASGLLKGLRKMFHSPGAEKGMGWLAVKRLKHYSTGPERIYPFKDKNIHYVNPYDLYLAFDEIFIHEIYQSPLPAKARILDCGANIGLATLYFKEICPTAIITAFEPDERNFDLLRKNTQYWAYSDVEVRKEAVWKEDATLRFSSTGDMASKINDQGTGVEVVAVRLKHFLQEKIDFLKIDIEGAEFEVLLDIEDALHQVERMFFEYHGRFEDTGKLTRVFDILNKAGFQFYIKEATSLYAQPFSISKRAQSFDVQLNIFCFRENQKQQTNR
jgi:FkbM family methyltransferase